MRWSNAYAYDIFFIRDRRPAAAERGSHARRRAPGALAVHSGAAPRDADWVPGESGGAAGHAARRRRRERRPGGRTRAAPAGRVRLGRAVALGVVVDGQRRGSRCALGPRPYFYPSPPPPSPSRLPHSPNSINFRLQMQITSSRTSTFRFSRTST